MCVCIDLIVCGIELEGDDNNGGFEANAGKKLDSENMYRYSWCVYSFWEGNTRNNRASPAVTGN